VLDENGLSDDRTNATRTQEPSEPSDDMDEKDDEIAPPIILPRTAKLQNCALPAIRHRQAYHLSHRNFEEEDVNLDFCDWESNGGLNIFMGMSKRSGLFVELRAGADSETSPTIKLIVGSTFR